MIIFAVIEYLAKILKPPLVYYRAVGQYQGTCEVLFFDHLQGRERLAESHLGIPQHLVALFEPLAGLADGLLLLRTEDDGRLAVGDV